MTRLAAAAAAACLLAGCIDIHPGAPYCDEDPPAAAPAETPLFHRDVRPILRRRCAACHDEDGIAGFSLDTYQEVLYNAEAIRQKVSSGEMPPWLPAHCCAEYQADASLDPGERATLLAWLDGGTPEGPFVEPPPPSEPPSLSRIDLELEMPEPYLPAPPPGTLDEVRCFLLDWPLEETTYVTGLEVVPGNPGVVHHALILTASAEQAERLAKQDADDPGPGWSCPGGIVKDFNGYLGGWTPGFHAADFPADLGQKMEPGSKLILTVHYSLHEYGGAPDQSAIRVKIDRGERRRRKALAVFDPRWVVGGMPIDAGDPDASYSFVSDPTLYNGGNSYTLYAVNLHMHERGSHGLVSIIRADGSTECLLQIDDWDYDYQNDFVFESPKQLDKGDRLYVECHWDNTAGNQRIINGSPEKPRDLNWGDDEEMCVAFVTAARTDGG